MKKVKDRWDRMSKRYALVQIRCFMFLSQLEFRRSVPLSMISIEIDKYKL